MSTPKQKIWDKVTEHYRDGPNLGVDNKTFAKYCLEDSVLKVKREKVNPTTSSNDLFRDRRHWPARGLAPVGNDYAGFKSGHLSSQLWLTTYPFMAGTHNHLTGDAVVFHVHLSAEPIAEPPTVGWASSLLSGYRADLPEVSSWRTLTTRLQIAPAPTSNQDMDHHDGQPSFVANDGPILRSGVDILYLDKTFWRQYFDRYNRNQDIFIPGVYPMDLSQIQNVAVDIAVLRNRDEFAAVARAVGRHLPKVTSLSAIVTKIIPRAVGGPQEQIALLEDGLPDVFISFDEKVRLGVHASANLVPAQGIVSANLSRLSLLATPTGALRTGYMLLTYFEDAIQNLDGGSADVDLPNSDRVQEPAIVGGRGDT